MQHEVNVTVSSGKNFKLLQMMELLSFMPEYYLTHSSESKTGTGTAKIKLTINDNWINLVNA